MPVSPLRSVTTRAHAHEAEHRAAQTKRPRAVAVQPASPAHDRLVDQHSHQPRDTRRGDQHQPGRRYRCDRIAGPIGEDDECCRSDRPEHQEVDQEKRERDPAQEAR